MQNHKFIWRYKNKKNKGNKDKEYQKIVKRKEFRNKDKEVIKEILKIRKNIKNLTIKIQKKKIFKNKDFQKTDKNKNH